MDVKKNEDNKLIIDPCLNCVHLIYEFDDDTSVYSQYADIKLNNMKIPISEVLEKNISYYLI